jgi:hypothetical protein
MPLRYAPPGAARIPVKSWWGRFIHASTVTGAPTIATQCAVGAPHTATEIDKARGENRALGISYDRNKQKQRQRADFFLNGRVRICFDWPRWRTARALATAYSYATLGEEVVSLVTKLESCRVAFGRHDKSLGN